MFTHQCRCLPLRRVVQQISQFFVLLPDLYLGRALLVKLMRYHFESHVTQIFPKDFVLFHSIVPMCLHESGCFALDPPKLNLGNKRHHGRGVSTKAQRTWIRLVSSDMWCLPLGGIAWLFSSGKHHMSLVNTAFRENFTGSSRYFTLRIFWGLSGPPVVTLSSQFLGALMQISIFNMFWEWQISKTV